MNIMKWVWDEENGQGMVEYALILIIVSVAAVGVVRVIGMIASGHFKLAADSFLNQ